MKKKLLLAIAALVVVGTFAIVLVINWPMSSAAIAAAASQDSVASAAAHEDPAPAQPSADLRIRYAGTDIDGPVMQAEDNDYYLRRNEDGEDDVWGCYFMDYECNPKSQNIIIYGHSLDDSMDAERFSQLKRLNDPAFAEENGIIDLVVDGEARQYQIFSSGFASDLTDHVILTVDPDKATMQEIIDMALARSQHDYGVEVSPKDDILTLSTCTTDGTMRYVVTAKLI